MQRCVRKRSRIASDEDDDDDDNDQKPREWPFKRRKDQDVDIFAALVHNPCRGATKERGEIIYDNNNNHNHDSDNNNNNQKIEDDDGDDVEDAFMDVDDGDAKTVGIGTGSNGSLRRLDKSVDKRLIGNDMNVNFEDALFTSDVSSSIQSEIRDDRQLSDRPHLGISNAPSPYLSQCPSIDDHNNDNVSSSRSSSSTTSFMDAADAPVEKVVERKSRSRHRRLAIGSSKARRRIEEWLSMSLEEKDVIGQEEEENDD